MILRKSLKISFVHILYYIAFELLIIKNNVFIKLFKLKYALFPHSNQHRRKAPKINFLPLLTIDCRGMGNYEKSSTLESHIYLYYKAKS